MAEDSDLEKTEPASQKKIDKAREDGDIPRSKELATCGVLFFTGLFIMMTGESLSGALQNALKTGLSFDRSAAFDTSVLIMRLSNIIGDLLIAFLPLAAFIIIVMVGAPIFVGGWVFSAKAFMPKFSKLNPFKGLKNMFAKNALVELVKSILKATLVGMVSYMVVVKDLDPIMSLSQMSLVDGLSQVNDMLLMGFLTIVSVLVVIAAIDVPYQLYQYAEKLKMTKQEVKDESKESDGNPELKAKIRQQQREMASRRMMAEIPNADVVITNPTHYAVAVQYKEDSNRAPVVIAKGSDVTALKIRELAGEHGVTVLESPKLARALFAHTELDDEIPEALFSAVAEVLAYVFQMRVFNEAGGFRPDVPTALPVPEALDPHSLMPAKSTAAPEVFA
jgi:flagellar biosynthetic protein FlhB